MITRVFAWRRKTHLQYMLFLHVAFSRREWYKEAAYGRLDLEKRSLVVVTITIHCSQCQRLRRFGSRALLVLFRLCCFLSANHALGCGLLTTQTDNQDEQANHKDPCREDQNQSQREVAAHQQQQRQSVGEEHKQARHDAGAGPDGGQRNHEHARHANSIHVRDRVHHRAPKGNDAAPQQHVWFDGIAGNNSTCNGSGGKDHRQEQ